MEAHTAADWVNFLPLGLWFHGFIATQLGRPEEAAADAARIAQAAERRGATAASVIAMSLLQLYVLRADERWDELATELASAASIYGREGAPQRHYDVARAWLAARHRHVAGLEEAAISARTMVLRNGCPFEASTLLAEPGLAVAAGRIPTLAGELVDEARSAAGRADAPGGSPGRAWPEPWSTARAPRATRASTRCSR